jgi:GT2 family glycosyltransferase
VTDLVATIIVVTHNSARWLARQRAALEAQTDTNWELIVVDNASRQDQRPRAEQLPAGAKIIQSEINLGFAAANNLAARRSRSPYIVLLNPDAFPEPDWLATLLSTAERFPDAGAIGSTQLRADAPGVYDGTGDVMHASGIAYRSNYGQRPGHAPPLAETFSACGAAMLLRRDVFEAAGGFDESYFCYFEDVDLCFRLRLLGWRILQSPDAIVAHIGGGSASEQTDFAEFHGNRNRYWTFVKCMPGVLFWLLILPHIALTAFTATYALLRVRQPAVWRGLWAGLMQTPEIWRSRQRVQRARKASIWAIARALAWSPDVLLNRRPVPRRLPASR